MYIAAVVITHLAIASTRSACTSGGHTERVSCCGGGWYTMSFQDPSSASVPRYPEVELASAAPIAVTGETRVSELTAATKMKRVHLALNGIQGFDLS